jgi:hypothetical protein
MKNYFNTACFYDTIGYSQTNDYIDISKKLIEAAKTKT